MAEKRKIEVETMDWDNNLDLNSLGDPVLDPEHPTPRNRARHHHILNMMLEVGNLNTVFKILAAYPYLKDEYGERVVQAVREKVVARRDSQI